MFEDGLGILRDRAREVHRFAQEKAAEEGRLHHQELEAMEHYYHDQFSMLVETLAREKEEVAVRDKAQKRVSVFEVNFGLYYYIIVIPFYGLSLSLLPPSLPLSLVHTHMHTHMYECTCILSLALSQLAQRLHRELHQRLEKEIQQLQDGLDRDEDAAHFRELDAEQMRHNLRTLPLRLHH